MIFYVGAKMKITRRQLNRLVNESVSRVLNESGFETMVQSLYDGEGPSTGHLKPDQKYEDAIQIHFGGQPYGETPDDSKVAGKFSMGKNVMDAIGKAVRADLSKRNYYVWKGFDAFWESGMSDLPAMGRKGDPYLYLGVGEKNSQGYYDKLQVAAGPEPRAMGKTFSNKKKIKDEGGGSFIGGLAQSSSDSSKDSSDSSAQSSKDSSDSLGLSGS